METKELKFIEDYVFDIPDSRDFLLEEYLEFANWKTPITWLQDNLILYSQWNTPKCTRYAAQFLSTMLDMLEDIETVWEILRPQKDPGTYKDNRPHTLLDRAKQFKELDKIIWFVSIPRVWYKYSNWTSMTLQRRLDLFKKALDISFLFTGTDRVKRTMSQSPILKFWSAATIWHAFDITWKNEIYHSSDKLFKHVNSFWKERGDNWYWYIEENNIDKLYTAYMFIDKKDSEYFANFKTIQKAKQWIKIFKELYEIWNPRLKQFLQEKAITAWLENVLWFKY